jgi:hypothetical protein
MGGPNGMDPKEGSWNIHTSYNGTRRSFGSNDDMHEKSTSMLWRKEQSLAKVMILVVYFCLFQRRTWMQDIISPHQTYQACFVPCMVHVLSHRVHVLHRLKKLHILATRTRI